MINPRLSALLLLAAALSLHADFSPQNWKYRRAIPVTPPQAMARLVIDSKTYQLSTNRLADLRIVRDNVEAPYVLEVLGSRHVDREFAVDIDRILARAGLEIVADVRNSEPHNRIRIQTPRRNFRERVHVAASDDRKQWAILREDAFIFDDSESDRPSHSLAVTYPATTHRYVKLSIPGWHDAKAVSAAWVDLQQEIPEQRETVLLADKPAATQHDQKSTYQLDLGFSGRPYDRLIFAPGPGHFSRSLELSASDDREHWSFAGSGTISRTDTAETTSVAFPEQWSRYLRIELLNYDDQPIAISRITLEATTRQLRFTATKSGQYWLYVGNPQANRPVYDLAALVPAEHSSEAIATLGPEQPNPAFTPSEKPISDRHPALLYTVLFASIIGMGYLAIRLLRRVV